MLRPRPRTPGQQHVPHRHRPLEPGVVRELEPARAVTGRVDMLRAGPQVVVHCDPAHAVFDPCPLQSQPVHPGSPSHGDQHGIALDRPAAGADQDTGPVAAASYRLHGRSEPQTDPIPAQRQGHRLAGLRFVIGQQPVRRFDQGHARTQPLARLRQLAPDGTTPDDDQSVRQRCQIPERLVGQVRCVLQSGDRRHKRRRSGADQKAPRRDLLIADGQSARILELGPPLQHVNPLRPQCFRRLLGVNLIHRALHPTHHSPEVDMLVFGGDPVPACVPDRVRHLRGVQQRFARHAPRPRAVATDPVGLDERHPLAQPCPEPRRRQPGGTGSDNGDVI